MIYLDNAATSFPKPERVYMEMTRCLRHYCANPGRGGHTMSLEAGRAVTNARVKISSFFNIKDPMRLCFTKNATEALNIAIKGGLGPGGHVITTCMEHNSVMRPLKTLEKDFGIIFTIIEGNEFGEIDPDDIKKSIRRNTTMIISTLSSNVNGIVMPVQDIGGIAREAGIVFLLDASQGAGSIFIDVEQLKVDLLAFSGHKGLLGPQGTGGIYVREGIKLRCLCEGGTGSNSESLYQPEFMPDYFESGTLNTPGIVGLCQGIEFIKEKSIGKIRNHKHKLTLRLLEGIKEIKGSRVYSSLEMSGNSGIAAVNLDGFDSTEISLILDREFKIATRAGFHCAPIAHRKLGTLDKGIVRFSPGYFNTVYEIDFVIKALKKISQKSM
ncbi:MAG: aminotransferase class V-fold PLP-dependent enzyme [Ruminiclostridium sp.]|nr:aminotransferase class V-fold PLP-dependent enzyme [Ruminiclostridium sp.]